VADDLVVRTRVAVTKRNLERINHLTETIKRREKGVAEFLDHPTKLAEAMTPLYARASQLRTTTEELADRDPGQELIDDAFLEQVRSLSGEIEQIKDLVRAAKRESEGLRQQLFESLTARKDVRTFLLERAAELSRTLTPENYWQNHESCEGLFYEYVDLLRGIALRSARFGDKDLTIGELFVIADELPSVWAPLEGWTWQSLAVPSRIEENRSTDAMVLRVGFPEWTFWALPLLQREFGHVYLVRKNRITGESQEPLDASLIADALATLVTGPAYACAMLLLRLHPEQVQADEPTVGLRAAAIIGTLRSVAEGQANLQPLLTLADRLEREWRAGIEAAGGSIAADEAAVESVTWKAALNTARSLVLGPVNGGQRPLPVWASSWGTVNDWANKLTGEEGSMDVAKHDDETGGRVSLLLMLNAAWLARVRPQPGADAPPEQLDGIADRAVRTMLDHIRPPGVRAGTRRTANVR
jgi:hypothetical protein